MNNFEEHLISVLLERNSTINEISAKRIEQAIERQTKRKKDITAARTRESGSALDKAIKVGVERSQADYDYAGAQIDRMRAREDEAATKKQAEKVKLRGEKHPTKETPEGHRAWKPSKR